MYTKCTRLLCDTEATNIDQEKKEKRTNNNNNNNIVMSIKNRVTSQDPLKENLFHTFCGTKCIRIYTYTHTHTQLLSAYDFLFAQIIFIYSALSDAEHSMCTYLRLNDI